MYVQYVQPLRLTHRAEFDIEAPSQPQIGQLNFQPGAPTWKQGHGVSSAQGHISPKILDKNDMLPFGIEKKIYS